MGERDRALVRFSAYIGGGKNDEIQKETCVTDIGVIGGVGYVGLVTGARLAELGYEVIPMDMDHKPHVIHTRGILDPYALHTSGLAFDVVETLR
jgi:hypothetical protein